MNKTILNIKNLSIKYKKPKEQVVKNISFKLYEGETVAILGPSGCGKTTIINAIAGLLDGEAIVGGLIEIEKEVKDKIRIVFQEPRLLHWRNIRRNISYGVEGTHSNKDKNITEDIRKVISSVGLSGYEEYYPDELSIGMKQRVNFARAIICKPKLLLMDEPFSAIDHETKKNVQQVFLQTILRYKVSTIFVTHNREEAAFLADRVIILSKDPTKIIDILDKDEYIIKLNKDKL